MSPEMQTVHIREDRFPVDLPLYGTWLDAQQLAYYADRCGSHFFDRDTMRSFRSRVHDIRPGVDGWYFITSEKSDYHTARVYSLRRFAINADQTGITIRKIDTTQYLTLGRARTALKHATKGGLS